MGSIPLHRFGDFFGDAKRLRGHFPKTGTYPAAETLFNDGKTKIFRINEPGEKINLHTGLDVQFSLEPTEKINELFEIMEIDSKERQQYFMLLLAQKRNPDLLDTSKKAEAIHEQLAEAVSSRDVFNMQFLVDLYEEKIADSDLSIDNFYDELVLVARQFGNDSLVQKLEELFERHIASLEKTPIYELERAAQTITKDTELSSELLAEFMGIVSEDEYLLYEGLRSFHSQNALLVSLGAKEEKPQDQPHLVEAGKKLNDKRRANFINNVAKLASDVEHDPETASFEKYGKRLLNIASKLGPKELAVKIFDILPNIFLQ